MNKLLWSPKSRPEEISEAVTESPFGHERQLQNINFQEADSFVVSLCFISFHTHWTFRGTDRGVFRGGGVEIFIPPPGYSKSNYGFTPGMHFFNLKGINKILKQTKKDCAYYFFLLEIVFIRGSQNQQN